MIRLKIIHHELDKSEEKTLNPDKLAQGGGLIGRHPTCDIVLNGAEVSRVHARFTYESGQYCFSDLGSTGGSMVNDDQTETNQKFPLKQNDLIRIGDFIIMVKAIKAGASGAKNPIVNLTQMAISNPFVASAMIGLVFLVGFLSFGIYTSLPSLAFPESVDLEKIVLRTGVELFNSLKQLAP